MPVCYDVICLGLLGFTRLSRLDSTRFDSIRLVLHSISIRKVGDSPVSPPTSVSFVVSVGDRLVLSVFRFAPCRKIIPFLLRTRPPEQEEEEKRVTRMTHGKPTHSRLSYVREKETRILSGRKQLRTANRSVVERT